MFTKLFSHKLRQISVPGILRSFSKKSVLRYELIKKEDYNDILRHVEENAFREEPLFKAADVDRSKEGRTFFTNAITNALRKNLSIVALTKNDEIAGVVINDVMRPGDLAKEIESFSMFNDVKLKKLLYLVYTLNNKADLFNCFDVDQILEMRFLSVDPAYSESAVRRVLINRTEELAKMYGFQLIKADTGHLIYQKVLKSSKFKPISEIFFSDYKDQRGEPAMQVELPHKKFQIMYRALGA